MTSLGFLRFSVFLVYISNVYDNLPTDEIATIGQREHLVESRAYLPAAAADRDRAQLRAPGRRAGRAGREAAAAGPGAAGRGGAAALPGSIPAAVRFWRACWQALRLQERYVPLHGLDTYQIAPGISGELLRPLVATGGDVRMHVSNGAAQSFAETLPLLHPYGRLQCHDIVATDPHQYRTGVPRPGQVRRLGGQLGERPAAGAHRRAQGLRRRVRPVPPARQQHHHDDRGGAGLMGRRR